MCGARSSIVDLTTTTSILVTLQDLSSLLLQIDVTEHCVVPFISTMVELQKVQLVQEKQKLSRISPKPLQDNVLSSTVLMVSITSSWENSSRVSHPVEHGVASMSLIELISKYYLLLPNRYRVSRRPLKMVLRDSSSKIVIFQLNTPVIVSLQ